MWKHLGFKHSPYDTTPLNATKADVELLVGRGQESVDFVTTIESSSNGVTIISGVPGVGKTSFLNVNQYLLESGEAKFGPQLLAARRLCPAQPKDDAKVLALRALHALIENVKIYCEIHNVDQPSQVEEINSWLSGKNKGFSAGVSIAGFGANFGRQVTLPPINNATFEALRDSIECIVSEIVSTLGLKGFFIIIDNLENLDDEQLASLLMTFRDTLFTIPGLWWVLIGQSGLSSLVQQLDKRVSDRLIGPGLELKPLSAEELDQAINLRVTRFHESLAGKAPLTKEIHRRLYDVSQGEIRFVFKYSHSICVQFVSNIRKVISDKKIKLSDEILNRAIGDAMIKDQISVPYVGSILRDIIQSDVEGLQLRHKDKAVLKKIGEKNGARAKDYAEYGLKSGQDFSSNYLTRFYESNLLFRIQEGRSVVYKLRGIALLASGYGFID